MTTFKLGRGDYELPAELTGGEADSQFVGRLLFCLAAISLRPESMETLFEISTELCETAPRPWDDPEAFGPILNELQDRVIVWCRDFGVTDRWFVRFAAMSVYFSSWYRQTRNEDFGAWFQGLDGLIGDATRVRRQLPERPLVLDLGSWDVIASSRQEFEKKARTTIDKELGTYLNGREQEAKSAGLPNTPEKRGFEPFFWLAGYQVCGWSAAKIADAENKDRRTVEKQMAALAAELALTVRPVEDYNPDANASQIRQKLRQAQQVLSDNHIDVEHFCPALSRILPLT